MKRYWIYNEDENEKIVSKIYKTNNCESIISKIITSWLRLDSSNTTVIEDTTITGRK